MHKEYLEYYKKEWGEYFVFNGHSSNEYGIALTRIDEPIPALSYDMEHIPGRPGEMITGSESYSNVDITYKCTILENAYENLRSLAGLLMTPTSYVRLEDSYHPDIFRMAICKTTITPEMLKMRTGANFEITFSCLPQQWLKIGELENRKSIPAKYTTDIIDEDIEVFNPTDFDAKPLFRFNTSEQYAPASDRWFTLTINGVDVKFRTITNDYQYDYVLDCETGETYGINKSTGDTFNINKFIKPIKKIPFLQKGKNIIHIYYESPTASYTPSFEFNWKGRWWSL